jgi:hypothetical protein
MVAISTPVLATDSVVLVTVPATAAAVLIEAVVRVIAASKPDEKARSGNDRLIDVMLNW